MPDQSNSTAGAIPRRLRFLNGGFLNPDLRRILAAAGHELRAGLPRPGEGVVVWGQSPTAWRGERAASRHGAPLIRVEDAFLRSLRPGRQRGRGNGPLGLLIDPVGLHYDGSAPSLIEEILRQNELNDSNLLLRAKDGIGRIQAGHLSKYNIHDPGMAAPPPGYVLLVDQTRGDASIRYSGASEATFQTMLATAREEHPTARIVIKTHPETRAGLRPGHFDAAHLPPGVTLCDDPISPWALLEGAIAVYTVSSQMGFEAILAGHRPRVFGQPFYAGWGLTVDEQPLPRRRRSLTRAQLFAAAMILAPTWVDPCRNRLCSFEEALDQLEADVFAWRADRYGHVALKMRLWKRAPLQQVFGREKPVVFADSPEKAARIAAKSGRRLIGWGDRAPDLPGLIRVEDGFLRSRGLGADLIPPLSLVMDDLGLYFDPTRESRLERLILAPPPPGGVGRAERLIARLIALQVSKYNLTCAPLPDLPQGHRILVPGQVEDDASIRLGAGEVKTNLALLEAARAANPDAVILYKPHPDVEAGLRPGSINPAALAGLADAVLTQADPIALIAACDEVWTITSTLGFEALLRGKPVTTLGVPFYAGWGLTRDLGPVPSRRSRRADGSLQPRPTLAALAHAALIAYPRYFDPVTRRPCPPEVALDRLAHGPIPHPGRANRLLAKLQGAFAGHAHLWRR
ncbi:capsular polysaccharide biosynthesis protein [Fuscovulum ytuae]|uniref:Capsular polysaccharide biosynthesis protein n=1 Tax=Fuscovulum ytuae TaxID=3042299 RepID=A0ABY8Q878_9RHOB|nr:capsular polysaccharide biosynthesis protein [Fuscovulum sp. YMD61]WGV16495.1 capsular polysaccharide biosynthesis protein [Fuscovulum sp. YMD61]